MNDLITGMVRRSVDLTGRISPNAVKAVARLKRNGYEAYLVGGCVRDLLLGREPKDFDVATAATPPQVRRLFGNCRLIGRRFRLAHLHYPGEIIEVATFRSSAPQDDETDDEAVDAPSQPAVQVGIPQVVKSEAGVILRDNLFGSMEDDMIRRDFTVNALSYDPSTRCIIDYVGGLDDLDRGCIRTIGDPQVRFTEDPVRMLRAVRFAAALGFDIEPRTWDALLEQHAHIRHASPSRLFDEVVKMFFMGSGERSYRLMRVTGLFDDLFPELGEWLGHESDGFPHTSVTKALTGADEVVRSGGRMSQVSLFSMLFGPCIEEKADAIRRKLGTPPQEAAFAAADEFFRGLDQTVRIPGKVRSPVGTAMACQYRFLRIPGKRAQSFAARPGFQDAFAYFSFKSELTGQNGKESAWWQAFARGVEVPAEEQAAGGESSGRKRRRRRGKRRNATQAARQDKEDGAAQ